MKQQCVDEETLADFIEGRLSDRLRADIELHLAACPDCLDQVAIYSKLVYGEYSNDSVKVPQKVTKTAIDAIYNQPESDSIDRLKNTAKKLLAKGKETIERLTFSPMPEFAPIRGTSSEQTDKVIRIHKTINNFNFFVEMDRTGDKQFDVRINLAAEQPAWDNIRISLFTGEREIASSFWRGTTVSFENIVFGTYALVFSSNGEKVADYKFEIQTELVKEQ